MKKPIAIVTDHAVLQYLARRWGVDIEGLRQRIGRQVDVAIEHEAGGVTVDGLRFVLQGNTVVTVAPPKKKRRRK